MKPKSRSKKRPRELRGLPLADELEAYDLPRLQALAERAMAQNRRRLLDTKSLPDSQPGQDDLYPA